MTRVIEELTDTTAFDIFAKMRKKGDILLESTLHNQLGRYTIAGIRPYMKVEQRESLYVNGRAQAGTIADYLKTYFEIHKEKNPYHLPFWDGAIGFFSYDYGREQMGISSRHQKEDALPLAEFTFYDGIIVEDHFKQKVYMIANGKTCRPEELLEEVKQKESLPSLKSVIKEKAEWKSDFSDPEYQQAIAKMIDHMYQGDIYVVNMTQQLRMERDAAPFAVYRNLRELNPAPFAAFMEEEDYAILCSSPERFLKREGNCLTTRPIKGTRGRGSTEAEDTAHRKELKNSEKDQCELRMIVDLERNDFHKICRPGSVKVPDLFEIEAYATVFHLSATVEGELDQADCMDIIKAAFPGGSITGAPKKRAMELIDEVERSRRGLYTGTIGYMALDGNCDFNIVIRTLVYQDGRYQMGAGGGITCESELQFETNEVYQKAEALKRALEGESYGV